MTLLKILGVLLIALLIAIPLLERFGKPHSDEEVSSLNRWILPLAAILVLMQMFLYWSD
tara:strand:- start:50604 stop:50780 length:177 start_codon:yes stop_codon:yes gene_type:complete